MLAPPSPKSRAALHSGAGCASASLSGGTSRRILAHRVCVPVDAVETKAAGRAYATYGGIYIVASLAWLWAVESVRPGRWDIAGASIMSDRRSRHLWGPRG